MVMSRLVGGSGGTVRSAGSRFLRPIAVKQGLMQFGGMAVAKECMHLAIYQKERETAFGI